MAWHRLILWTLVEAPCIRLSDRPGGLGLAGPGLYYYLFISSQCRAVCHQSRWQFLAKRCICGLMDAWHEKRLETPPPNKKSCESWNRQIQSQNRNKATFVIVFGCGICGRFNSAALFAQPVSIWSFTQDDQRDTAHCHLSQIVNLCLELVLVTEGGKVRRYVRLIDSLKVSTRRARVYCICSRGDLDLHVASATWCNPVLEEEGSTGKRTLIRVNPSFIPWFKSNSECEKVLIDCWWCPFSSPK
jgi:hypothetical protein